MTWPQSATSPANRTRRIWVRYERWVALTQSTWRFLGYIKLFKKSTLKINKKIKLLKKATFKIKIK